MLSTSLKGVLAQTLCKKIGGGRVAAHEILVVTNAVSSLIRDGKTYQIPSAMQVGAKAGMCLLNDTLMRLVREGMIESLEAYHRSVHKAEMLNLLREAGNFVDVARADMADEPQPPSSPVEPMEPVSSVSPTSGKVDAPGGGDQVADPFEEFRRRQRKD